MTDSNRSAFVTGANRGLGFEICRQLGEKGHQIFLGCRDLTNGQEAAKKLSSLGVTAVTAVRLDATDTETIKGAYDTVSSAVDSLDVLVNNAGTFEEEWGTMPSALTIKEMRDTFDANFFGPFEIIKAFFPLMLKSIAPRIVNISSDMGSLANINNRDSYVYGVMGPAYQSSKVAINALTTLFAKEVIDSNFKINSASPGWCRTDMGTDDAPLSVAEGASTAVRLATLPDDGPTGEFFSSTRNGDEMEW